MTPADRLLWAVGILSVLFMALGIVFAALSALADRLAAKRSRTPVLPDPDPRVHRAGSCIEYDFKNRRRVS